MLKTTSRSTCRRVTALTAGAFLATTAVRADWPTAPESPLPIGPADSSVPHRHVVAPDGATWLAWIDALCQGDIRLQRVDAFGTVIAPDGIVLPGLEELCGTTHVLLATLPDGDVIVQAGGPNTAVPLHRVEPDGTLTWGEGLLITDWIGGLGAVLGLPGGDVLVAGHAGSSMFVNRHLPDGGVAWTAEIATNSGPNKRVFALVPDDAGGAFIVWDRPLSYTRLIDAAHVAGDGVVSWPAPLSVVGVDPSSSRHTDPVAVADGAGGVTVVFTMGREAPETPAPLLVQRFDASGVVQFPPGGADVSLDATRQFDPIVARDAGTNDLVIAWRNGPYASQFLRAQRLTSAAERLWGDDGVTIAALGSQGDSHFTATWNGAELLGVISRAEPGVASVIGHRVDASGFVDLETIVLSAETDAMTVASGRSGVTGGASTISWFELDSGFAGALVAQRVHPDGTLGIAPGDVDGDGVVGFTDLVVLLGAWGACPAPCAADFDDDGTVGLSDLLILLAAWT